MAYASYLVRTRTIKAVIAALLVAVPAMAQTKPSQQEAESFRLTMPLVQGTISAYSNLIELLASDPALAERFKQVDKSLTDKNGRDTMSLVSQKLQTTEPRIAAAFQKAGVTAKTAGMTMECLIGTMLGDGMLQGAKADTAKLPAYVTENLAFYRQNKAEIQEAFRRFTAVSKKAESVFGKDDEDEKEESEDDEK
jgi:hypothetical protein